MIRQSALQVLEIERFALHDGPGIRTTVFLKGCPLCCPWCANPESQKAERQLMYFENKCKSCGECAGVCPAGAISGVQGRPVFNRGRCTSCGTCAGQCPNEAIDFFGRLMTPDDILAVVMRDKDYYEYAGGGVTVSGGEPLVQADGTNELLKMAKLEGLHTALDTCGEASATVLEASLKNMDLILFDLKHDNADTLKKITGADLGLILDNLTRAVRSGREVIARVPVIPGFNYDTKTLSGILKLAKSCGVRKANLLPYHTLGKSKYARLGRAYTWDGYGMLGKDEVSLAIRDIDVPGMEIKIGV